jgi:hypothetical protein
MILKFVVKQFGLSMIGLECRKILVGDQRLFCNCWIRMRVDVPNRSGLLSRLRRLGIWCCS